MHRNPIRRGLIWGVTATLLLPVAVAVVLGLGGLLAGLGDAAGGRFCLRLGLVFGGLWAIALVATTALGGLAHLERPLRRPRRRRRRRGPPTTGSAVLVALAMSFGDGLAAEVPAVSFSRQVAPILARSCGGCHVSGRKGGFQMASYEGLMASGMVQRGQGQASRLIDVILSGDMPRGGGRISRQDVATLIAWIDAGAACDAANPAVGIDALARGGAAKAAGPPSATPAIKPVTLRPGEVSFAAEVAPLLQQHCLRCHGGDETESGFSMASLQTLLKGGRTGGAIVAGAPADSLLVKKIRGVGIEGQRMPIGRPPLTDAEIATISRWIDQGARLDMLTATTPLDTVVAKGRTQTLSYAELATLRNAAGERIWRRAIPDEEPVVAARAGVCLIGNLPADRLTAVADVAEEVTARLRREIGGEGPLLKGGVVVFATRQAVDYSAIWQNVTGGERPKGLAGHSGISGDVVYGALLVPAGESTDDLRAALADVIGSAAFAGRAAPEWFCQGAGRILAGRIAPKADLVRRWRSDATDTVPKLGAPADVLGGHTDPAATAVAAGGFLGPLATAGRLAQMATSLDAGITFDDAFSTTFRTTPGQALEKWVTSRTKVRGGR